MLQGTLEDFPVADVLRALGLLRRTGTLVVGGSGREARIDLVGGRVRTVVVGRGHPGLGPRLVAAGAVSASQLDAAVAEVRRGHGGESDVALGRLLVSRGLVTADQLTEHLHAELRDATAELLGWRRGSFRFEARARGSGSVATVGVDNLLLVASRRDSGAGARDQRPRLRPDAVVRTGLTTDAVLDPTERRIVAFVDGRRTVAELVRFARVEEEAALASLRRLAAAGVVEVVGPEARPPTAPTNGRRSPTEGSAQPADETHEGRDGTDTDSRPAPRPRRGAARSGRAGGDIDPDLVQRLIDGVRGL